MLTFQQIIFKLQNYWADKGCTVIQPFDMEVGAGTSHPATCLRALGPEPWFALTFNPAAAPKTAAMATTPTVCNTTINSKLRSNLHQPIFKTSISTPCANWVSTLKYTTSVLSRTTGKPYARRLGLGLGSLAQRHGSNPIHLLPTSRRYRLLPCTRRNHLRYRAPCHVSARRGKCVRPRLGKNS